MDIIEELRDLLAEYYGVYKEEWDYLRKGAGLTVICIETVSSL